jgi:pilus assembly protein CpaB
MLLVALVFGGAAAFLAKTWLETRLPQQQVAAGAPTVEMGSIVVAAKPLRFGTQLSRGNLRELEWPAREVPAGAFAKIGDVLSGDGRRAALAAVEVNEPVLNWKITGPGQRASLSARIDEGYKAVSIRVTEVIGVAGFVLPGERVDVLLTRRQQREAAGGGNPNNAFTDVLLQNVRVLATGQLVDERSENPSVEKTVTIEVTTEQAQKIALGSAVGELSLALRGAGSVATQHTRRVSLDDLAGNLAPAAEQEPGDATYDSLVVGVVRGVDRTTYNVPARSTDLMN